MGGISFQIAHDHCHITIGHTFLPGQFPDIEGSLVHFLLRRQRFEHLQFLLLAYETLRHRPEQIFFQVSQRRRLLKTRSASHKNILLSGNTRLLGQLFQICHRLLTQVKKLLLTVQAIGILSLSQGQRHDHFITDGHQFLDQAILYGGKSGETIEYHHAPRQKS